MVKAFELLLDVPGLVVARVNGEVQVRWEAHLVTETDRDAHLASVLPQQAL